MTLSRVSQPVYNIEVHGEHVYQVGELGLLVHNTCADEFAGLVGTIATRPAHLPAGVFPALVVDSQVYVARMHNVAWELAGKTGVTQFYGFAEIDALGKVLRLFK